MVNARAKIPFSHFHDKPANVLTRTDVYELRNALFVTAEQWNQK